MSSDDESVENNAEWDAWYVTGNWNYPRERYNDIFQCFRLPENGQNTIPRKRGEAHERLLHAFEDSVNTYNE